MKEVLCFFAIVIISGIISFIGCFVVHYLDKTQEVGELSVMLWFVLSAAGGIIYSDYIGKK